MINVETHTQGRSNAACIATTIAHRRRRFARPPGKSFDATAVLVMAPLFVIASLLCPASNVIAETLEIATLPPDRQVSYSRDVAPVLKKNCVACHNASNEEGGVNLESVADMQASDVEAVLVPGKPEASRLFILASHAEDPVMPPTDNDVSASSMSPVELALLRHWIKAGAIVDQAGDVPATQQWQPLPDTIQTVYGTAMTPDGRLSAVSFGNQIQLYGTKSDQPFDSLEIVANGQSQPPHDDFVQDLLLDDQGQRIISAGYRNVKLWKMAPLHQATIPLIESDDAMIMALNPSGTHLAMLSPRGEISVALVGQNRWQWMKGFDVPTSFQSETPPRVLLAVAAQGQAVALAWNTSIRIVRIDGTEPESIEAANEITSLAWNGQQQLLTGHSSGSVGTWRRIDDTWTAAEQAFSDQPINQLISSDADDQPTIAIDASGKLFGQKRSEDQPQELGKLPSAPLSVALEPAGKSLWVSTPSGALGRFDLAGNAFVEVAKLDPLQSFQSASENWETLVGEKLTEAKDKSAKQVEANIAAEQASLETIAKDIAAKTTTLSEQQMSVADAMKAAQEAAAELAKTRSDEQSANAMRDQLQASIKQLGASISELEKQLALLKSEQAETEKKLAAIPDAKQLAESVKRQTTAAENADKQLAEKSKALSITTEALQSAEATKTRGEARLAGLNEELQGRQLASEQAKLEQQSRVAKSSESKTRLEQSKATDQTLAVLAGGTRILTQSPTSQSWSLWTPTGEWVGPLPDLPPGGKVIASGDHGILIQQSDGKIVAWEPSTHVWQHHATIGAAIGESPFADRVLCLDIDPAGKLLATGGGEPSRGGEVMLWNPSDGTLIRRIDDPHADTVLCLRFSPDGSILATGSADRMIKLWDVASGTLIKSLEGHTHHVTTLAWNVDGQQLASGSADATVKIWDVQSGQSNRTISGLKSEITRLVYLGRDDRIGITCGDSYFRVYRTDNGGRETDAKIAEGYLYALDSNRDGTQFLVGGADGVAAIIDKSGKQLSKLRSSSE